MQRLHPGLVGLLVVLVLGLGRTPAAARPLSLDEALALAERQNLELRVSELESQGARARARGALGQLGPALHLDANVYEWNAPFSLSIAGMPFLVRQAFTSVVTVSGTQPLLGLWPRVARYQGRTREREAARWGIETARAEVRLRVVTAYLALLEAGELETLGARAVSDAEEQVGRGRALAENGRLLDADVLRLEVALARARQELLEAQAARLVAAARLAATIGLPFDEPLEPRPVAMTGLPPLPALPSVLAAADRQRPEIGGAVARAAAARAGRSGAIGEMLPSLDVTGGYQHTEGQAFFPRDAGYVAGVLSWDFWTWGSHYQAVRAADAQAQAAAVQVARQRRDVSLEVVERFVQARTAEAALGVARAAVAQAEEAYRVTRVSYDNARATTTDLLDAELAMQRARVAAVRAGYQLLGARAALDRAVGASR